MAFLGKCEADGAVGAAATRDRVHVAVARVSHCDGSTRSPFPLRNNVPSSR